MDLSASCFMSEKSPKNDDEDKSIEWETITLSMNANVEKNSSKENVKGK